MPYKQFNRQRLKIKSLSERVSDMTISDLLDPSTAVAQDLPKYQIKAIEELAERIRSAKKSGASIIFSYGAHLIKNGLGLILNKLIENKWITLLTTNGAGTIHDWELAYFGQSTESVRHYVGEGQFGIWEETGRYMNLAIILGAIDARGYGESLGEMIESEKLIIPSHDSLKRELHKELLDNRLSDTFGMKAELLAYLEAYDIQPGVIDLPHPYKGISVLRTAFIYNVPLCVLPGIGYDIIYSHYLNNGAAIGKTSVQDFLTLAEAQLKMEGGVYVSIGSAIMSPMTFEKTRAMARNIAFQEGRSLDNTLIAINDIQPAGDNWDMEPTKDMPGYYLRFLKTFRRMHGEFRYIELDNRSFLLKLHELLK